MPIRTNPPLQVVGFIATRRGDSDRGPQARIRSDEAAARLMDEGVLVWVQGPRRSELAALVIDNEVPRGGVVLRDIAGVTVSEIVRLQINESTRTPTPSTRPPETR
jgi:hypothetical protein